MSENEKNLDNEEQQQPTDAQAAEVQASTADAGDRETPAAPPVELVMVEGAGEADASDKGATVQRAKFSSLQPNHSATEQGSIDLLLDVRLDLRVELGRASVPVREVLQLGSGSIVALEKLSGEPVDILVNGKPIAKGEVVVVDENFGVRVTEIVNRSDNAAQVG